MALICGKCNAENQDGEMFCINCGTELYSGENVSKDEAADKNTPKPKKKKIPLTKKISNKKKGEQEKAADNELKENKAPEGKKKKRISAEEAADRRGRIFSTLKIAVIAAAVLVLIIAIILVITGLNDKKGERIASKVPIGRNIEYCEKETGEIFSRTSIFPELKAVAAFDYLCESEDKVTISGITMPKWAVMVDTGADSVIKSVEYYNFNALAGGWKGTHSDILLTKETVQYGMDKKAVQKAIGFEPYFFVKSSDDTEIQCYRYYIIDNETGNERVFNYFVEFNDINGTVINAYDKEINYVKYILGVSPSNN